MYILTNGNYYARVTDTNAVIKTLERSIASLFETKEEASSIKNLAPSKLKGYKITYIKDCKPVAKVADTTEKVAPAVSETEPDLTESAEPATETVETEIADDNSNYDLDVKQDKEQRVKRSAIPQSIREMVYSDSYGRCAICGSFIPFRDLTIDHIVPVAKGGTNERSNLQPACRCCNQLKQDMDMDALYSKIFDIIKYHLLSKEDNKKNLKRLRKLREEF